MTEADSQRRDALPAGTPLRDYTLESVIGHGGFGIVYRARHDELDLTVAVKEYLPVELAIREGSAVRPRSGTDSRHFEDGLRRFRDEARALIAVRNHASIVSCRDFFRAHGTAYLVMEHEDGVPLEKLLVGREAEGRPFGEDDLLAVMVPLLQGLALVHAAGILHRDIKPSNIFIRRGGGEPVLIDFGAAKQVVAKQSKSLAPYTEGYAALEQVADAGELGPWTDLYGAGAVMWRMVAGGRRPWDPPNPLRVERRSHAALSGERDPLPSACELGVGRFNPEILASIDKCLRLQEAERVQSCGELLDVLRQEKSNDAGGPVTVASVKPRKSAKKPRAWKVALAAMAAALVLSFVAVQWRAPATEEGSDSVNVANTGSSRPGDRVEARGQVASRTDQSEPIQVEGIPASTLGSQRPTDVTESVEASGGTRFDGNLNNEIGNLDFDTDPQSPEDQSEVSDQGDRRGETAVADEPILGGAQDEPGQQVESPSRAQSSDSATVSRANRRQESVEQRGTLTTKTDAKTQVERVPDSTSGSHQPTDVAELVEAGGGTQFDGSLGNEIGNLDSDTRPQSPEDQSEVSDQADRRGETAVIAHEPTSEGAQDERGERVESPIRAKASDPVAASEANRRPQSAGQRIEPTTKTDPGTRGAGNSRPQNQRGSRSYWTVGSHEDDVLRIQGTPKGVSKYPSTGKEVWTYGYSTVEIDIRTRRVLEWNNRDGTLRVEVQPGRDGTGDRYWTVGSHEDDVLRIQGTPKGVSKYPSTGKEVWTYGYSTVEIDIRTRRVLEWNNRDGTLRVEVQPGRDGTGDRYWTVGSHEDDVLRIQGTPKGVSKYPSTGKEVWTYGYSTVEIDIRTRRVLEWNNRDGTLKADM